LAKKKGRKCIKIDLHVFPPIGGPERTETSLKKPSQKRETRHYPLFYLLTLSPSENLEVPPIFCPILEEALPGTQSNSLYHSLKIRGLNTGGRFSRRSYLIIMVHGIGVFRGFQRPREEPGRLKKTPSRRKKLPREIKGCNQ